MAILRFPKEKPRHTELLDKANDLLRADISNADNVAQAYRLCEQCADEKSPRGNFCQALMLYLAQSQTGEDLHSEILSTLDSAIKAKYPFAYDFKADILSEREEEETLYRHLRSAKGNTPSVLYYLGGYFAGLYEAKGAKRDLSKASDCFYRSAQTYLAYDKAKKDFPSEFDDYILRINNANYFSEQAGYALQMLMYVYAKWNIRGNKPSYLSAYADAQKYGNAQVKYKTAVAYAEACMDNVMGMYSYKTATSLMERIKVQYHELSKPLQQALSENYEEIWDKYDDFCKGEQERLTAIGEIPVRTANELANDNALTSLAHDLGEGIAHWANSAASVQQTEYTVTMEDGTYKLNELGEMVDAYGQRNGLHVDTTNRRVYDSKNNAIGFFDSFGEYHSY